MRMRSHAMQIHQTFDLAPGAPTPKTVARRSSLILLEEKIWAVLEGMLQAFFLLCPASGFSLKDVALPCSMHVDSCYRVYYLEAT